MDLNNIYKKIENALSYLTPNKHNTNTNTNTNTTTNNTSGDNVIDLQKTFSASNVDVLPVIKHILSLSPTFPNNILNTSAGHKYNELEFFKSNNNNMVIPVLPVAQQQEPPYINNSPEITPTPTTTTTTINNDAFFL